MQRTLRLVPRVDLGLTLGPLRRGHRDPCTHFAGGEFWRATRTPDGPATARYTTVGDEVEVEAWGEGAAWLLDAAPLLVGAADDPSSFEPRDQIVADCHRRLPGLRICRSQAVFEALVPTIVEQKVTGEEARRSYARLVRHLGEPAPGPGELLLPPSPARLAATPYWIFHPHGIERRRADAVRRAALRAHRLEQAVTMDADAAQARIAALPGVGRWSAAAVALIALGDADAVPVGDYHLPHLVSSALTGERRGDDARMLELLEPYRPHRGRVLRLLVAGLPRPPRRAPRAPLRSFARF